MVHRIEKFETDNEKTKIILLEREIYKYKLKIETMEEKINTLTDLLVRHSYLILSKKEMPF